MKSGTFHLENGAYHFESGTDQALRFLLDLAKGQHGKNEPANDLIKLVCGCAYRTITDLSRKLKNALDAVTALAASVTPLEYPQAVENFPLTTLELIDLSKVPTPVWCCCDAGVDVFPAEPCMLFRKCYSGPTGTEKEPSPHVCFIYTKDRDEPYFDVRHVQSLVDEYHCQFYRFDPTPPTEHVLERDGDIRF